MKDDFEKGLRSGPSNDLMKDEHPAMPISKDRQSRVTFGGGAKSK